MDVPVAVAFWSLAAVGVLSALAVVALRNLFRAALFLALSFLTVAGFFVLLQADFLAAVQILIYVGAISILIIFAIMLTQEVQRGNPDNRLRWGALILSALLLASIVFVIQGTDWPLSAAEPVADTTSGLAALLLQDFVLPFEVASVLLVAAIIGAIVIAMERREG